MTNNILVTGPPRSGKTTVIQSVVETLTADGYDAGGIYCPERREAGERVGFNIIDVETGETRILAHVDRDDGPSVGKYRVNVDAVDAVCATAFPRAIEETDFVVIDEIAPMEVYSDECVTQVRRTLNADIPVLAAIHYGSTAGFIGDVKGRGDVDQFEVTTDTREDLPARLIELLRQQIQLQ